MGLFSKKPADNEPPKHIHLVSYKCRRCNQVFESDEVPVGHHMAEHLIRSCMQYFPDSKEVDKNIPKVSAHQCEDGIGVADFVGFKPKPKPKVTDELDI